MTSRPSARSSSPAPTSTSGREMDPRLSCGPPMAPTSRSPARSSPRRPRSTRPTTTASHRSCTRAAPATPRWWSCCCESGANPSRAHPEGETPLLAAARSGSVPTVRLLLARGVDVNAAETFQKTTALMWAAAEGHIEVVDLLIEAGADVNRQAHITSLTERHNADHPTGGFTALMYAARAGNDALVRRLVARGANVNLKNGDARVGGDGRHLQRSLRCGRHAASSSAPTSTTARSTSPWRCATPPPTSSPSTGRGGGRITSTRRPRSI